MNERFWDPLDALVRASEVVVDRPAGSAHPRFPEFVYPYDHGYLAGASRTPGPGSRDRSVILVS